MTPIPNIDSKWRTATVLELCASMREAQNYSALPILADALQEAGCPEKAELLATLRGTVPPKVESQRLVALVYTEETAAAVEWMVQFVRSINYSDSDGYDEEKDEYINPRPSDTEPHTFADVIGQGYEGKEGGKMYFGSDAGAAYFRDSEENVREFYRNWALVTGERPPDDLNAIGFSCAC